MPVREPGFNCKALEQYLTFLFGSVSPSAEPTQYVKSFLARSCFRNSS